MSDQSLKVSNNPRYRYKKPKKVGKLKTPLNLERVITSVPYPETNILTDFDVYDEAGLPSVDVLIEHFLKEGRINEGTAIRIMKQGADIFKKEDNLIEIDEPISICGDIHGQFFDLITLFKIGGYPPKVRYLFLGDYVDRGCYGIEVVLVLWSLKIAYPSLLYLLRGNHECRYMTENFTFKREIYVKYSSKLYDVCMNAFDCLPLAALINREFLCMHGGLSPEIQVLSDIRKIYRLREPPVFGPMCDLLWSDPIPDYDTNDTKETYFVNTMRGCSYFFSFQASVNFLKRNSLLSVIRAHEVKILGFQTYRKIDKSMFPSLMTVFSAPNYLDVYNNKGAILRYENKSINIKQFTAVPHPFWLNNFTDAFTYTIPFVCEHALKILIAILNVTKDVDEHGKKKNDDTELRAQIRSLGQAAAKFSADRKEMEIKVNLRGLAPGTAEVSTVSNAKIQEIKRGNADFQVIKQIDEMNEKNPAVAAAAASSKRR